MRLEKSPPRVMFITCSGRKSGDDRSAPMPATRSCVCGLPGLSTITTRAAVIDGAPSCDRDGEPRSHAPNAFSASARSSGMVMSPATTSAALFGTKRSFQNACMSARDIAFTDASVPISAKP